MTYQLTSIAVCGNAKYRLTLKSQNQSIETVCHVKRVQGSQAEAFETVEFQSEEFNKLVTFGQVYAKPLGKAVLAFHECVSTMAMPTST